MTEETKTAETEETTEETTVAFGDDLETLKASGEYEDMSQDADDAPELTDAPKADPEAGDEPADEQTDDEPGDDRADYYKAKSERLEAELNELRQFSGIIGRLQQDDEMLDILEDYMAGNYVDRRQDYDDDDDAEGGAKKAMSAEQRKAEVAMVQKQMQETVEFLMQNGVEDHVADDFVQWAMNPTGVEPQHFFNLYKMVKNGDQEWGFSGNEKKDKRPRSGAPITTMPGKTDRPDGDRFVPEHRDGTLNYHGDPNNL